MEKLRTVVLGEALMDFLVPRPGVPLTEAEHIVPTLGGAPANVAVQVARLGQPASLVTAVGNDPWGQRLLTRLAKEGVDCTNVQTRTDFKTGLTFIEVADDAERTFHGWRHNAADQTLAPEDIGPGVIEDAFCLHRGTVSLFSESARRATNAAVARARAANTVVALDINLRFSMFKDRAMLLELARDATDKADLVKATQQEADALFGAQEAEAHVAEFHARGARLVFVTQDKAGALVSNGSDIVQVPTESVREVDATGAGDAFWGAVLATLAGHGSIDVDAAQLETLTRFACTCGAASVTALGATAGMKKTSVPTLS